MKVFNTGCVPGAQITAVLLVPDTAGTAADSLITVTTHANAAGVWEFNGPNELLSQAQAAATFGVATTTWWQITEPRPGGADPTVWSVYVTGGPGIEAQVSALTAVSSPLPIFGASGGTASVTSGAIVTAGGALALTPLAAPVTAAGTDAVNTLVPVSLASGSVVRTLPAAPADGSRIAYKIVALTGSNTLTVNAAGSDVFNSAGGSTALTLKLIRQSVTLQYRAAQAIWYVVDGVGLAELDSRYQPTGAYVPAAAAYQSAGSPLDYAADIPRPARYASNPVFAASSSALGSIYWTSTMKVAGLISSPLDNYYTWYSTDHDNPNSSATGGIGLLSHPTPLGPFTDHGQVYVDTANGYDTECAAVAWDPVKAQFVMYYKEILTSGAQVMYWTASANGQSGWSTPVAMFGGGMTADWPGGGYFSPWRVGNKWYSWMINGGGNYPHYNLATSDDGYNWRLDPKPIGPLANLTPDGGLTSRWAFEGSVPFLYRGRWWVLLVSKTYVSGANSGSVILAAAPIDLGNPRSVIGNPIPVMTFPSIGLASISAANPAVLTTVIPHGRATGDTVTVAGETTITAVNGTWTATVLSPNTLSIPANGGAGDTAPAGALTGPDVQSWETSFRCGQMWHDPGTSTYYLYYITASSTATPVTNGQLGIAVLAA